MKRLIIEVKKNVNMIFYIPSLQAVSGARFIDFWKNQYDYKNENLYADRIKLPQYSTNDIKKFYEWKNGGKLSEKKREFINRVNNNINIINQLKINFDLNKINMIFNESAIWKIFLLHIIQPNLYPMFDQYVCFSYHMLTQNILKGIPYTNKAKEKLYFKYYYPFFDLLVNTIGNSRKTTDEALWAFGRYLKNTAKYHPQLPYCLTPLYRLL